MASSSSRSSRTLANFRAGGKWPAYLASCDYFAFAVPAGLPQAVLPEEAGLIVPMPTAAPDAGNGAAPGATQGAAPPLRPDGGGARLQQSLDAAAVDPFAR